MYQYFLLILSETLLENLEVLVVKVPSILVPL
jgi:hypothetical protein